jgi:hypothetical protein
MQEFRRKQKTHITAVCLDLDTDGFTYQKWGGSQKCKRGDWLVNNNGEVYTIDAQTFSSSYHMVSPGVYEKGSTVWAREASESGRIQTKEGSTAYDAKDYLVFNDRAGKDGYAIKQQTFHSLYEPVSD